MEVGALRQIGRIDLHDRPEDDDRPIGLRIRESRDEVQIHALVDDSVEAEPRPADAGLVGGPFGDRSRLVEMGAVDAGGEGVDVGVAVLLGLVEAVAPGEDHVGSLEQLSLERGQLGRGEAEVGQLVHAVVDGAGGLDLPRNGQHHRGVVPANERAALPGEEAVQQASQNAVAIRRGQRFR